MRTPIIKTLKGAPPSGPYSMGMVAEGKFLFVSGQGPYDPSTGDYERRSVEDQTELTLRNVQAVVEEAGGCMDDAVACRVYLSTLNEETFEKMNSVYRKFFPKDPPARTTVGAQLLGIDVEIDLVVLLKKQA